MHSCLISSVTLAIFFDFCAQVTSPLVLNCAENQPNSCVSLTSLVYRRKMNAVLKSLTNALRFFLLQLNCCLPKWSKLASPRFLQSTLNILDSLSWSINCWMIPLRDRAKNNYFGSMSFKYISTKPSMSLMFLEYFFLRPSCINLIAFLTAILL